MANNGVSNDHRERGRGPRIAAIGGGTGLSTFLRGIKERTSNVTGVVTVSDDGGSSGILRHELGILPPGDIRNCIVALAEAEPLMKELFEYRFTEGNGLAGHSFGNLFIAAMSGVTGNFEQAVSESSRVLKVTGRIVPSTLVDVRLTADMADGTVVLGETNIAASPKRIRDVQVSPAEPEAFDAATNAIRDAELTVIGPGSLYTSLIPNLLIPGIARALIESEEPVVYVCNIATQPGETDGYTLRDHLEAIDQHLPGLAIDYVVANSNMKPLGPDFPSSELVEISDVGSFTGRLITADLMNDGFRGHHDPVKLASVLMDIHQETRDARHSPDLRRSTVSL